MRNKRRGTVSVFKLLFNSTLFFRQLKCSRLQILYSSYQSWVHIADTVHCIVDAITVNQLKKQQNTWDFRYFRSHFAQHIAHYTQNIIPIYLACFVGLAKLVVIINICAYAVLECFYLVEHLHRALLLSQLGHLVNR